jgi:Pentatricopeptide repeat domain
LQSLAAKREPDTPIQASHRALQAHSILHKLASHDPATRRFEPAAQHFDSVMVAWSRSHHPNAAQYCQQVFERLVELADQANSRGYERVGASDTWMKPTSFHYNTLITTWGLSRSPGAFQNVLTLFQRMKQSGVKLELSSYTAVLFALSRSQSVESAQMADTILTEMEKKSRHPEEGDQSGTEPTVNCYNSLLYAWCHSGAKDAHTRCEVAFRRLMAAYEESGWNPALRPDSTSYVTLIDSFVNKQSLSDEAGAVPAAVRAEEILNQMEALAAEGLSDPPDAKVYTTVMKAHWKSGQSDAALKVEEIVKRMKIAYEAGNTAAKPDVQAMTVLIRTWAKSDAPDKAKIAWEIHKEMRDAFENGDTDMQPNSYSLSAVLNACAFTNTRDQRIRSEAVKVALMAMNELDNGINEGLNEHSFQNMFQVLVSQIDDLKERTRFASVIFQQCCQAGYVSRWTLLSLKKHVPALYRKLPASPDKALNLPEQWTRHVAKADRHDAFS